MSGDGLSYSQRSEVKGMINSEFASRDFWNSLNKLLESIQFTQAVKEKAEEIVPKVSKEWTEKNLRIETESYANNYMRNNFLPFFRREISENREVQGFVSQHLTEVSQKVRDTTSAEISKIVNTSSQFNPIFQSHLDILSQRNASKLSEQSRQISESVADMRRVKEENERLRKRLDSLEESNGRLTGLAALSFAGVIGLGVHAFFGMSKL